MPFHLRRQRWAILVAHRRAGKTVAAVNDLVERASYNTREAPRYAYIAPFLKQAKAIAWEYLKRAAAPYNPKISEAELYVELTALPNQPRITIYGADNPDSFRGMYFDGVVLDEFGSMLETVWKEVLLPALVDRRGWAVFMGTPNGPNHFRDMWYKRAGGTANRADPAWFTAMHKVTDTGVIPEDDLAEMREIMDPEEYEQEMMCNFEASVRGSIYARQVEQLLLENRAGHYPIDPLQPVDLVMDLGFKDQTTMGFCQRRFDGILLGHSHGDNLKPISSYISYAKAFWEGSRWRDDTTRVREGQPYRPGQIWLPHDARAKTLVTGKSIIDNFRGANLRPKIVPQLDLIDGIAATRLTFPLLFVNTGTQDNPENDRFLLAAKTYHRKFDPDLKRFSDEPVHDWSSDWMDMLRYLCIVQNPRTVRKAKEPKGYPVPVTAEGGLSYGFALNDIWDCGPSSNQRRPYG